VRKKKIAKERNMELAVVVRLCPSFLTHEK
jgi:hypothetical protein